MNDRPSTHIFMPMQTALHIMSLVSELQDEVLDGKIVAAEFYRKERTLNLIIKKKQRLALSFVYHPTKWGTYLVPASKINIDTREKPRPVFDIADATITNVEQHGLDRILTLTVKKSGGTSKLVIEAIGPNGNIWLLDKNDGKQATLRRKDFKPGESYSIPPIEGRLNPFELTEETLASALDEHPGLPLVLFVERYILGFNTTLSREVVHRADLVDSACDELDEAALERALKTIQQICENFATPASGYMYQVGGKYESYPFKLSFCKNQPHKFKTLSMAVMASAEHRDSAVEQQDEVKTITDVVKKAVRRLEKRLGKVEKDIEQAADYEHYRRMGELLQINFKSVKKGMSSIVVQDVYTEPHEKIEIQLDPSLSPNENAEAYFKKYRKGREGLGLLQRRLEITRGEISELSEIQADLERDFESARQRYQAEIASLVPGESTPGEIAPRLPYKPYTLSTGLTIFIGRDGSDNDRTTFEFAKPFELWFHAQQCPGSHVVMKFPNKSFEPSKKEIEETAAIAAYYSKARNDSLVPVIYTQRKYVRKPRKAKPGLVTVEREKSVMVEPTKPD